MKQFDFYFTKKDGYLRLCSVHKMSGKRSFNASCLKNSGINVDEFEWDNHTRQFKPLGRSKARAIAANMKLLAIVDRYEKLSESLPSDVENPFTYNKPKRKSNVPTLGEFLLGIVSVKRNGKPSKSYQNYLNLYRKLECEGHIINLPITSVNDAVFAEFGHYIVRSLGGTNYSELMKLFKATISKAWQRGIVRRKLTYDYSNADDAPTIILSAYADVLSRRQWESFCSLDMEMIHFSTPSLESFKGSFKDFCIFMYETDMRPCDVYSARRSSIRVILEKSYLCYVPQKKKYMKRVREVAVPLSETALAIINKYSGEMILPMGLNEIEHNIGTADGYKKWDSGRNNRLGQINRWLKELAPYLGFTINSLYTIRHTSITHKCNISGANIMMIAKQAGTSVKMIEQNYYSIIG